MKNYLMGVDLGTTNVKAAIYDIEGRLIASAEAGSYDIISENPNWAEQDARIWWEDAAKAMRAAIEKSRVPPSEIAGICVSSQGMAMLPLDADGNPLCNAHIWMDRRGADEARYIEEALGADRIMERFGVKSDPYYQVTNILWFKRNRPELWKKTRHIVKANTYLNYRLTGKFAIDEPQAIMSMCYDIRERRWSSQLGNAIDIDFDGLLPRVAACEEVLGYVTKEAGDYTGLACGTPVMVGSTDTDMALLEMGIMDLGDAGEITGTSSNNVFPAMSMPPKGSRVSFFPPVKSSESAPVLLYGPTNATGENVRWFRRLCGLTRDAMPDGTSAYQYLENLAARANPGCGGLFFYPYLMGERAPLWNNDARGMFIGLSTNTDRASMLRAIYEGTCFAQREIRDEVVKIGNISVKRMFVSGGCARSDIWMRIKASVLNLPINVMISGGGSPKGDAILAGFGVGIYGDLFETAKSMRNVDKTFEPIPEWTRVYDDMYPLFIRMRNHLLDDMRDCALTLKKRAI